VIDETLREADQKMRKAVDVAKDEFAAIRTGRAHPAMFAKITADYYGSPRPSSSSRPSTSPSRAS
jgi:ribosome recycling factor